MMNRQKGWEIRLANAISAEQGKPFEWAQSDCAHLMAASIQACHPKHKILRELKRYSGKRGALLVLKREGGLAQILSGYFEPVPVLMAVQGDVGIVERDGVAAGCVVMDGCAIGKSETGLFRVPIKTLDKAFSV